MRPTAARNRNVIIAAAISVVVIVMTLFVLAHIGNASTTTTPDGAQRAAQAFYTAVQKQDYTTAWTYLSDQQQGNLTQYSFTLFAQQEDTKDGVVTKFQEMRHDADTNDPNQETVQEQVTRAKNVTYVIKLQMIHQADGSWKILSEDRTI
jgi:hypothetical protein